MTTRPSTALVSYQSSSYQSIETDGPQPRSSYPNLSLVMDTPTIFNVDLPDCPNPRGREVTDPSTGEMVFIPHCWIGEDGEERHNRCGKNSCEVCSVTNARRIAGAIRLAEPPWSFSLTLVGGSAAEITKRVSSFVHYARRDIPSVQVAWAAEENSRHTGVHVHGFLHAGDHDHEIGGQTFDRAVARARVGRRWQLGRVPKESGSEYLGYPFKSLVLQEQRQIFLHLNGSPNRHQLVHSSNHFWRDGVGGPTLTRREAERIAYEHSRGFPR
jgi:hypothetical protein